MTTAEVTATTLTATPPPATPKVRALEWVRRTWQPTQEQVNALVKTGRSMASARLAAAAEMLRAVLGGPTREELGELSRRLSRIEARLEALGIKEIKEKELHKERRSA